MHAQEVKVVGVDAEVAREYLSHNEANRNLSWPLIHKYATDMLEGRWLLSTDMIGFDTNGRLIQGQHRLMAVTVANEQEPGIVVPMMVAWGFPPNVFDVLDQGKMRSAAQVIGTHGLTNTTVTAAVARQILYYDQFPNQIWKGSESVSRVQVIEFALAHREELVAAGTGTTRLPFLNHISYCVLHYLVNRESDHEDRWDEWNRAVTIGENLPPGHPALAMRNGEVYAKWGMGGAQPRLGVYIKAWNAFVEDRPLRVLVYRRNELPLPKVK